MAKALEKVVEFNEHEWNCSTVHFHPTAPIVASGSWDRTVRIWDIEEKACLKLIERGRHKGPITCVRWHPNHTLVASTSADKTTCLWDVSTGQCMKQLHEHFGWVLHCSFAPDRTKLATASWDKTIRLWDPSTGQLISTLKGHSKGVLCCEFYPVGHSSALLATCGEDSTARLWDTRSNKVALTLSGGHADTVSSISWSLDGSLLASTSADETVGVWDPKAGRLLRLLKGHDDAVKEACFSINGPKINGINSLATVGGNSLLIWNPTSNLNNLLGRASHHLPGKEVESVSFSSNGKLIATGGRDGKVIVCRVPDFTKSPDIEVDVSDNRKSRILNSWLNEHEPSMPRKKKEDQKLVKEAMEDERGAWVRRQSKTKKTFTTYVPKPQHEQPSKAELEVKKFEKQVEKTISKRRASVATIDDVESKEPVHVRKPVNSQLFEPEQPHSSHPMVRNAQSQREKTKF